VIHHSSIIILSFHRDTYFTAEDAKSFGVIDQVIATRDGSTKLTADLRSISNTLNGNLGGKPSA
jgi:Clp protease